MATQRPISTISYNTTSFFEEKCKELYDSHIIQNYMFINHKGEDGDKNHIHAYFEPNKRLDVMDLFDLFLEYVPTHKKPLACRPFRQSKEEDWILYAVHNEQYLKLKYGDFPKGEKIPYKWQDIICSPYFDVETCYIRALASLRHTSSSLVSRIQKGESLYNLALQGESIQNLNGIMSLMKYSDSARIYEQFNVLQHKYDLLCKALYEKGITFYFDEKGNLFFNE